jgi:hypothetical protein
MSDRLFSPLRFFRSFFKNPPEHENLRAVSPRDMHPDDLRELYSRTMKPIDETYSKLAASPRGYHGPHFDEMVERTLVDESVPFSKEKAARDFVNNQLQRVSSARNLLGSQITELEEGHPGTYRFLVDPQRGALVSGIATHPLKPTARLGRAVETGDVEEIRTLASPMPGTGLELMRVAQEAYDPKATRATSLMSLPKAEPFYEGKANMLPIVPSFIPERAYRSQDWNWQSHVKPKGQRFAEGGRVGALKRLLPFIENAKHLFSDPEPKRLLDDARDHVSSLPKDVRKAVQGYADDPEINFKLRREEIGPDHPEVQALDAAFKGAPLAPPEVVLYRAADRIGPNKGYLSTTLNPESAHDFVSPDVMQRYQEGDEDAILKQLRLVMRDRPLPVVAPLMSDGYEQYELLFPRGSSLFPVKGHRPNSTFLRPPRGFAEGGLMRCKDA